MSPAKMIIKKFLTHSIWLILLFPLISFCQNAEDSVSGTVVTEPHDDLDLSEISKKSAELSLLIKTILRKVVKDKELEKIDLENKQMIQSFDSLLVKEREIDYSELGKRKLQNKMINWKEKVTITHDQIVILNNLFIGLDKDGKKLRKEKQFWQSTDKTIRGDKLSGVIHRRIVNIESLIDTTLMVLDEKSAKILMLLDEISRLEVDLEMLLDKIETAIQAKNENYLLSEYPSIFGLPYGDPDSWYISKSLLLFDSDTENNLKTYFIKHKIPAIAHLLFLIFFIVLLNRIRKVKIRGGNREGGFYKKRFKTILSRPISAAFIVGLFSSLLFYQNRPLFIINLSQIIIVIPILIVLIKLLPARIHFYVYSFGLLTVLLTINNYLAEDSIISRLVLLVTSSLLSIVLLVYLLKCKGQLMTNTLIYKSLNILLYILFVFSILGFIGSIAGQVLFAEYVIDFILGFAFIAILLTLSNLVLGGLFIFLVDSHYVNGFNTIKKHRAESKRKVIVLVNIATAVGAIYYLFFLLKIKLLVYGWLLEFFTSERTIGSIIFTWGNIALFFLVIWLSTVIGRNLQLLLEEDVLKKMKLKKGLPHTIAVLFKYSLVSMGVVIAFSAAGIPMSSMTMLLGAFGVGIGFGLQNIFNNLVSGLILLFERPIQINDTIEVGTLMGKVKSIGIRSSNVRTYDGAEIIVPNGHLISNEVINWTLSDEHRRIEVIASVSYASDPNQVKDVLLKVIRSHPKVSNNPGPDVLFREMGDSSLNFRLLFWTREFSEWVKIRSEITFGVFYALKEAGIEIPFPQTDLHLRSIDEKISFNNSSSESEIE